MTSILAPFSGTAHELHTVPDPVFAQGMMGAGVGLSPEENSTELSVLSPCQGTVARVMPHAVALMTEQGHGILVHVGINTVQLNGEGFTTFVGKKPHR